MAKVANSAKLVTFLETSAKPNTSKDTKNYMLSEGVPDKASGKGLTFITNGGEIYLHKARLAELGIERAEQIKNIHLKIEIEKV